MKYKLKAGITLKGTKRIGDETFGVISDGSKDSEIPLPTFDLLMELQKGDKSIDELVEFRKTRPSLIGSTDHRSEIEMVIGDLKEEGIVES